MGSISKSVSLQEILHFVSQYSLSNASPVFSVLHLVETHFFFSTIRQDEGYLYESCLHRYKCSLGYSSHNNKIVLEI